MIISKKEVAKMGYNISKVRKASKLTKKEKEMYIAELTEIADNFLKENYDLELSIPIKISNKFKHYFGWFSARVSFDETAQTEKHTPLAIYIKEKQIAYSQFDDDGFKVIVDVLKHELIHYALCELGYLDYGDGEKHFEQELADKKVASSGRTKAELQFTNKNLVYYEACDIYYIQINDEPASLTRFGHTVKDYSRKVLINLNEVKTQKRIELLINKVECESIKKEVEV